MSIKVLEQNEFSWLSPLLSLSLPLKSPFTSNFFFLNTCASVDVWSQKAEAIKTPKQ